jgi:hypothetical protein
MLFNWHKLTGGLTSSTMSTEFSTKTQPLDKANMMKYVGQSEEFLVVQVEKPNQHQSAKYPKRTTIT